MAFVDLRLERLCWHNMGKKHDNKLDQFEEESFIRTRSKKHKKNERIEEFEYIM